MQIWQAFVILRFLVWSSKAIAHISGDSIRHSQSFRRRVAVMISDGTHQTMYVSIVSINTINGTSYSRRLLECSWKLSTRMTITPITRA